MIKRYNNLSFVFFIPGIIIQMVGFAMSGSENEPNIVGLGIMLIGTILSITGFGYYAKAKGRSAAWGGVGFLGLVGLVILALLKDRSGDPWNT